MSDQSSVLILFLRKPCSQNMDNSSEPVRCLHENIEAIIQPRHGIKSDSGAYPFHSVKLSSDPIRRFGTKQPPRAVDLCDSIYRLRRGHQTRPSTRRRGSRIISRQFFKQACDGGRGGA